MGEQINNYDRNAMLINNVTSATAILTRLNDTLIDRRFTGDEVYLYEAASRFLTAHFKIQAMIMESWLTDQKDKSNDKPSEPTKPNNFGFEDGDSLSSVSPS